VSLLQVTNLVTEFLPRRRVLGCEKTPVRAVDGVTFELAQGDMLGIVGESGSGKSTLAKTILGLYREKEGSIILDGRLVSNVDRRTARRLRSSIQYMHQDPGAALDPWWNVGSTMHEALSIHRAGPHAEQAKRIDTMLEAVGLHPSFKRRYPHELSGGQQRRVGLARTLLLNPRIVILDEPTSGLDLSVQATVLMLIRAIRQQFTLTYVIVSHDLAVVRNLCNRVAIMHLGRIVEIGGTEAVFLSPQHEYTSVLLNSSPSLSAPRL
jgi:ABC-type glutathione transport system ATPase component